MRQTKAEKVMAAEEGRKGDEDSRYVDEAEEGRKGDKTEGRKGEEAEEGRRR